MKRFCKFLIGLPLGLTLVLIATDGSPVAADQSELWGADGECHEATSRLPEFSFAGYHAGEKEIPDVPVVTNASDFGAVGDGVTDDTTALQDALNATNGGALFIPAGRYRVTFPLRIFQGGKVIRGAGEGETTIYCPRSLSQALSLTNSPYGGGFLEIKSTTNFGTLLGKVSADASRGDSTVMVDRPPLVEVGDYVRIESNNADSLGRHLLDGQAVGSATPNEYSNYLSTVVRVAGFSPDSITFDRPLRLDLRSEWECEIYTYSSNLSEVGVEDLSFEMEGTPKRAHNNEEGFNAIHLDGGDFCWVRRVTFIDTDNALLADNARYCQFSDLTLKAAKRTGNDTGHHGLWVRNYTQDCLFTRFNLETSFVHDLSVEGLANGNVFSKGTGVRLNLDHHANLPYENLFTDLSAGNIGRLYASGGRNDRKPHTAARSTLWNIRATSGSEPSLPNWPLFNVIGVSGYTPNTSGTGTWVEPISNISPPDIHLAQRERRLGDPTATAPESVIVSDRIAGISPLTVQFDGSSSSLEGGTIDQYLWTFGDGTTASGATASHVFTSGATSASLQVTGSNGRTATTSVTITGGGGNLTIQAEDAEITNSSVATLATRAGWFGSGYVDVGSNGSVQWNDFPGGAGGETTLTFRYFQYSNFRTEGRANVIVNGNSQSVILPRTGFPLAEWLDFNVVATLNSGNSNTIRIQRVNDPIGQIDQLTVSTTSASVPSYTQWQGNQNWGDTPSAFRDFDDDPDGDGLNNGLERVLGTNPVSSAGERPFSAVISPDDQTITLAYPKSAFYLQGVIQQSDDLQTWSDVTSEELYSSSLRKFFHKIPVDFDAGAKLFYRVKFD